jgi:hypothetical protein
MQDHPDDMKLIAELTRPRRKGERPTAQPLLRYLKRGGRLTLPLRRWLIDVLSDDGETDCRLILAPRGRGRPRSREAAELHDIAYARAKLLAGREVSRNLADKIQGYFHGALDWSTAEGTLVFHVRHKNRRIVTFSHRHQVTKAEAFKVVGLSMGRSTSWVAQIYYARERRLKRL